MLSRPTGHVFSFVVAEEVSGRWRLHRCMAVVVTSNAATNETLKGKRNHNMGGKRIGSGRKAIKIDLALLEKVCTMQCTDVEHSKLRSKDSRILA